MKREIRSDLHGSDAPQIEELFGQRCEAWKGRIELAGTVERVD
jgi:hypothetical protein